MTQQSLEPRTTAEDAGEGTRVPAGRSWLDRYFHISQRGSTLTREVRGGVTTFMAMAYILLLNPLILSGKDASGATLGQQALITATAFAAALSTLLMGFMRQGAPRARHAASPSPESSPPRSPRR